MRTITIRRAAAPEVHVAVSDVDFEYLSHFRWQLRTSRVGTLFASCMFREDREIITVVMSRVILQRKLGRPLQSNEFTGYVNDPVDGVLNYSRENLQVISRQ